MREDVVDLINELNVLSFAIPAAILFRPITGKTASAPGISARRASILPGTLDAVGGVRGSNPIKADGFGSHKNSTDSLQSGSSCWTLGARVD
jgi:hypothetical protein